MPKNPATSTMASRRVAKLALHFLEDGDKIISFPAKLPRYTRGLLFDLSLFLHMTVVTVAT